MRFYLTLFVAAAIFAISFSESTVEELSKKLLATYEECRNKTGVTEDQLKNIGLLKVPTQKPPQCFLACISKKMGVMTNDNKIDKDAIMELLKPLKDKLNQIEKISYQKIENIMTTCSGEVPSDNDECVVAKNIMECEVKYAKKEGLIP